MTDPPERLTLIHKDMGEERLRAVLGEPGSVKTENGKEYLKYLIPDPGYGASDTPAHDSFYPCQICMVGGKVESFGKFSPTEEDDLLFFTIDP